MHWWRTQKEHVMDQAFESSRFKIGRISELICSFVAIRPPSSVKVDCDETYIFSHKSREFRGSSHYYNVNNPIPRQRKKDEYVCNS